MNKSEAGLERRFCPGIIRQGCAYCRCPDRPCMQNPIFYGDYDRNEKERKTHEGVVMLLTNAGELVLWNPWLQSLHGYFFYFYEVKQLIERESCWWIERGRGGIYRGERLKRAGVVFGVAIDWKREILMSREGGEVFIEGKGWKDGGCVWCGPLVLLSLSWFGPLEKILRFGAQTIGFVYPVFHVLSPVWDSAAVVFHPIPRFLTRFGHVCHYTQY